MPTLKCGARQLEAEWLGWQNPGEASRLVPSLDCARQQSKLEVQRKLLQQICSIAVSYDGGKTACSLRSVSRTLRDAMEKYRFASVALETPLQMSKFLDAFRAHSSSVNISERVRHLFLSVTSHDAGLDARYILDVLCVSHEYSSNDSFLNPRPLPVSVKQYTLVPRAVALRHSWERDEWYQVQLLQLGKVAAEVNRRLHGLEFRLLPPQPMPTISKLKQAWLELPRVYEITSW
ncbi:hypothetical protein NEOLEDRAFT_1152816 [Neolentinus lepideus HHB14362 ss-1]|uniref:Uncharacterized protein n=1 Tax=Neolentinus lepideus HHB14362 ss-1 TaxID=1314782 RepID=A0A165M9N8_9AGAM|nr:hypothetical protein NEOLEDRAFT_1152816 [Neolentinus lepideus HHB14362 ss-1]